MSEATAEPVFEINTSRGFESFFKEANISLAFTTYQTGMIFMIGSNKTTGKLFVLNRSIERPMGLAVSGKKLAVAALTQVVTFVNSMEEGDEPEEYDAFFVPQIAHFTGDLDIHDIVFAKGGNILFANTLLSCVASVCDTHSFQPVWRPSFISRLAPEDRCHLNGIALDEKGDLAFASVVGETDIADGWRDNRRDGGAIYNCQTNEKVAGGLSMPHSPRMHNGALWVLNSGTGEFGSVELGTGRFNSIAFCPGYLRGLAFAGPYAFVGLSEPRENKTFAGLALQERLDAESVSPRCGIYVIDIRSGDVVHWLTISGVVNELYDIAVIKDVSKPYLVGFKSSEIRRVISIKE